MKEKTKAYYKTVFKWWAKNRLKPFLIKAGIVLLIVAVALGLFVLLISVSLTRIPYRKPQDTP